MKQTPLLLSRDWLALHLHYQPMDGRFMKSVIDMLAGTADGAMLVDEEGKVVFWNKAAERLLGYRATDIIGQACHDVLHGETLSGYPLCSPSCGIRKRLACGGAVRNFDMRTQTKLGRTIWLNISSLPVPSHKQGRFLAAHLFRDITKQARARRLADELHAALRVPIDAGVSGIIPGFPSARQSQIPAEVPPALPLSKRKREVLQWLASGVETKSIADRLCISPTTVRNHVQHILDKLGAHNRLQALAIVFPPRNSSSL